jgi:hypothetical protein
MSWKATAYISRCQLGSRTRKVVMLFVADAANEDLSQLGVAPREGWSCCPAGLKTIATGAEVSRATVKRVLADMEAAGLIVRESRYRTWGDGGRTSDLIWVETARLPMTIPSDFRAPRREVSEAHREASRRGGRASAQARGRRGEDQDRAPDDREPEGVRAHGEPGVRAHGEPGQGLTVNPGSGSQVNPHDPSVDPLVDPPDRSPTDVTTGRASTDVAQTPNPSSGRAPAPPGARSAFTHWRDHGRTASRP